MDDLESRLSNDLSAPTGGVGAGRGLEGAVKKKVRRRQLVTSLVAAVPVLLLIVGAVWLVDLTDGDGAADLDTVVDPEPDSGPVVNPDPVAEDDGRPTAPEPDPRLAALGADVDGAPRAAITLGATEFCGSDEVGLTNPNPAPLGVAQCLITAAAEARDAVMLCVQTTIEGDPIVNVVWTRGVLFETDIHIVSSQDSFGGPGWVSLDGDLVIFNADDDSSPLNWDNCRAAGSTADDAGAEAASVDGITLAPGEATTIGWPDQSFFFDAVDEMDLFLITPAALDATRSWAHAGTATRNDDGTSTLSIFGPSGLASLTSTEFCEAALGAISPGVYDLVPRFETTAITQVAIIGEANSDPTGGTGFLATDSGSILGRDALGDAIWGETAGKVLPRFADLFGRPLNDEVRPECLTLRVVEYGNGLTVWFGSDTDFALDDPDAAGLAGYRYLGTDTDAPLTTRDGVMIGSSRDDISSVGGSFTGRFLSTWGADGWFVDELQGGSLSHDFTDARARVTSIAGGAQGNPERMVC